jgi:16S rRNA processing protein RimM
MSDWVVVGKLMSPFGVKGWLKLYSHTQPVENIATYEPLWMKQGDRWQPISLEHVQRHGKGLVVKIKGCETRDQTPAYIGCDLAIKREQLPALEQGDYYWTQLEGLKVVTTAGEFLGVVDHLLETGSNDVLVVHPATGSIDQQERLIPYLWEDVVTAVDLERGEMTVDWDKDF